MPEFDNISEFDAYIQSEVMLPLIAMVSCKQHLSWVVQLIGMVTL